MKKNYIAITLGAILLSTSSCDKDFEEINTNPNAILKLDPAFQLTSAELGSIVEENHYQAQVVQYFVSTIGGFLLGANQNQLQLTNSGANFVSLYTGPIRNLIDIIEKTKDDPARVNIHNMARILKAYNFMRLVDTYGDVPYTEAGKAYLGGVNLPKYDNQEAIYEDILIELEDATSKLDVSKDIVTADIFYRGNIDKWKKFGNSLLLRAGMRFTKIDEAKAKSIVQKAVDPARGGVMTSNADNATIKYNANTYTNTFSNLLIGSERANNYATKTLVDYLKKTNDPRGKYILVRYTSPSNGTGANTNLADQVGTPLGKDAAELDKLAGTNADNPPKASGSYGYSQLNRQILGRPDNPEYIVTYAQTSLLLAEAAHRGYISGDAKTFYETGVKAALSQFKDYAPDVIDITEAEANDYLQQSEVAWDPDNALEVINEQYWLASFRIFTESWSNFRRSGYPDEVQPIRFPGEDPSVSTPSAGGFIRRLVYPIVERSVNTANYEEAASRIGGDNLGTRIFWDKN